jgi:hypothetical protein
LAQITDPHDIMWAHDDLLFVSNADNEEKKADTVFVYSLPDLSLQGMIGGPDVFDIQSAHSVELFPHPDRLVVNSSGKVSTYSYELELENDLVPPPSTYFVEPFGGGFVARDIHNEDDVGYYRLNLYDAELNLIRELCRKEFEGRAFSGDFSKQVYGNELYVAKRTDEFVIEVFDRDGSITRRIEHDYDRVEVTEQHREEHMAGLTSRPGWEKYFSTREEMEQYFRNLVVFPDRFPAIRLIRVAADRIYVLTNSQHGEAREIWILDLEGTLQEKRMVPFRMQTALRWYPLAVHQNHLYQLLPNETTGTWELLRTTLH